MLDIERSLKSHRNSVLMLKKHQRDRDRKALIAATAWVLPQPSHKPLALPTELVPDALFVWDFFVMFNKQLRLSPMDFNDFALLLTFDGKYANYRRICPVTRRVLYG